MKHEKTDYDNDSFDGNYNYDEMLMIIFYEKDYINNDNNDIYDNNNTVNVIYTKGSHKCLWEEESKNGH